MKKTMLSLAAAVAVLVLGPHAGQAADAKVIELTIKGHAFHPATVEVPAGEAVIVLVKNEDPTPEEFESKALHLEKVIQGNKSAKIRIPALKPGEYPFVGEYHEDDAKGVIFAK